MMLTKRVAVRVPRRVRWAGSMVTVDNPYTGETVAEVDEVDEPRMLAQIDDATSAHDAWATTRVSDRLQLLSRFVESFEARSDAFARQVSMQMGKPLSQAQGEMKTTVARAKTMMAFAEDALADYHLDDRDGIQRKIAREPIGPVLLLCPWNCMSAPARCTASADVFRSNAVCDQQPCASNCCREFRPCQDV